MIWIDVVYSIFLHKHEQIHIPKDPITLSEDDCGHPNPLLSQVFRTHYHSQTGEPGSPGYGYLDEHRWEMMTDYVSQYQYVFRSNTFLVTLRKKLIARLGDLPLARSKMRIMCAPSWTRLEHWRAGTVGGCENDQPAPNIVNSVRQSWLIKG